MKIHKDDNEQKKIPTGKLNRSTVFGATTVKASLKKAGYLAKTPFLSEEGKKTEKDRIDDEIAALIFKALSRLRGTALKLAQAISMEIELLPEAYQRELSKAASRVPPINRALVRKIITTELGKAPENIFHTFDTLPFAAASLGQVHHAVSHDGDVLAVKVQYPGIAEAIKTDMTMLRTLLKPTRYYNLIKSSLDELEERFLEEVDYEHEAKNTVWFYENLEMEKVIIPKICEDFSAGTVLTTEKIEGKHLDEWLEGNPGQEEKNHYGQILADLFTTTVYQRNLIHADPNPGNYIFRDDKRLGLIDFGCIKALDKNFTCTMATAQQIFTRGNTKAIPEIYAGLGVHFKSDMKDETFKRFIISWLEWITRPAREEYFDFAKNQDHFNEGKPMSRDFIRYLKGSNGSMVYYGRAEHGLFRILQKLGARVSIQIPEY